MTHARIGVYQFQPGTTDDVIEKARQGARPLFEQQPGFISYTGIKTDADSALSITFWESAVHADQANQVAAEWIQDRIWRRRSSPPRSTLAKSHSLLTSNVANR